MVGGSWHFRGTLQLPWMVARSKTWNLEVSSWIWQPQVLNVEKRCSMKKTHVCIVYNFINIYTYNIDVLDRWCFWDQLDCELMFWLKSFQNVLKLTPCEPICRCFCCLFTVSSVLCFIPYSSQRSSSQTFSCVIAVEVEEIAPWPKRERSTPPTMVRGAPSRGANGWKRWLAWFAHRSLW